MYFLQLISGSVWALGLLAAGTTGAAPTSVDPQPLRPDRIELLTADGKLLSGLLDAVSDRRGRLRLLAERDLRVYGQQNGRWKETEQLKTSNGERPIIRSVAIAPDGDSWLLTRVGERELLYFVRGEEKDLPDPGWMVMSAALPGGTPTVAIAPIAKERAKAEGFGGGPFPLVLQLDGDQWIPLAMSPLGEPETQDHTQRFHQLRHYSDVLFANGTNGSLWVAPKNAYVVREYSSAGKLRIEISTDKPKVEYRDRTREERAKFEDALKGRPAADVKRWESGVSAQVPKRVFQGLSAGDGSRAYMLREATSGGPGLELDRYDAVLQKIEHLRVEIPRFAWARSFVATSDGLVVVSASVNDELWLFPCERLEEAHWQPNREAHIRASPRS